MNNPKDWKDIKHFKPEEFNCPCCGKNNINMDLVRTLDRAREIAGVPFIITSGYRCDRHNAEVGGKQNSSHLSGYAVDIKSTDSKTRYLIIKALLAVGFTRIGVAKDFIHADKDSEKPQDVVWVY